MATKAVTIIQEGHSRRSVGLQLGFSRRAIPNLWNHFQKTGSARTIPRLGRVRITTAQGDRNIRLSARRDRTTTTRKLHNRLRLTTGTLVSDQTICNLMHEDQEEEASFKKASCPCSINQK